MTRSCSERVWENLMDRMEQIDKMLNPDNYTEEELEEAPALHEYGLCFDYVPAGTFSDQEEGFFRWQLSTGGPGDEFRFMTEDPTETMPVTEYWFLDWFDGANVELKGINYDLINRIWTEFRELGMTEKAQSGEIFG